MTPDILGTIIFLTLAAVAIGSAVGMLLSQNAVHSALYLVLNFCVVAVFFLGLGAPFIAMVQVTVYAGAIMVLFLFVIMLLGAEVLRQPDTALPWQRPLALLLTVLFLGGVLGYIFLAWGGAQPQPFATAQLEQDFGGPINVGLELYRKYLLPFELTSFLLLVGMIGAVILTRDDRKSRTSQVPAPKAD